MKIVATSLLIFVFGFTFQVFAHEGHHNEPHEAEAKSADASTIEEQKYDKINLSYEKNVK